MCRVACDMIRLLADHSQYLVDTHPDFVKRIIEGLCYTLELHIEIFFHRALLKDFKNVCLFFRFVNCFENDSFVFFNSFYYRLCSAYRIGACLFRKIIS